MSIRPLFIAFAWFVPAITAAQDRPSADTLRSLDLDQIIEAIRIENPDLQASRLATNAMSTVAAQVSALPDPMVMVTVLPFPVYTARGKQRSQFRIEQPIPFPGKLGLKADIADLAAEVNQFGTGVLEDDLILAAKVTYFELYRLQRHEQLIHEFHDKLRDFENVASTQYEVGRGMQQAILKAQLERNTLSKRLLDISWQRKSAAESLSKLIDGPMTVGSGTIISVTLPVVPELDTESLLSAALQNRPEAGALNTSALQADAAIELARKQYLPDFAVNLAYFDLAASDVPPNADGRNALALGVSVKVPLQRGRLKARVQETRLKRSRVDAGLASLEARFRTRIADFVSRIREDLRQMELYQQALIPEAETTLEATLSAYTTGRTDFLNLLDAERVLFTVHTGYEDVYARYLKTVAGLEREIGVQSISEITAF